MNMEGTELIGRVIRPQSVKAKGFTLIELLVVMAIIAILAAILFPVFAKVKEKAKQATCESNMRQIGIAFAMYEMDNDDRMPDRRDLKAALPGGYKPWTTWPASDPRSGWAVTLLSQYVTSPQLWSCPSMEGSTVGESIQVRQPINNTPGSPVGRYWLWRFDQMSPTSVALDNFWGKTDDQAITDLIAAQNLAIGTPMSTSDVELAVDPYFPKTVAVIEPNLKGKTVHTGGRNRLYLDGHVKWSRDPRTDAM